MKNFSIRMGMMILHVVDERLDSIRRESWFYNGIQEGMVNRRKVWMFYVVPVYEGFSCYEFYVKDGSKILKRSIKIHIMYINQYIVLKTWSRALVFDFEIT